MGKVTVCSMLLVFGLCPKTDKLVLNDHDRYILDAFYFVFLIFVFGIIHLLFYVLKRNSLKMLFFKAHKTWLSF